MEPTKKLNPVIVALIVIVLLGAIAAAVAAMNNGSDEVSGPASSNSSNPSTDQGSSPSTATGYKDGMYSASGAYSTPGGRETIDLQITLTDGKVQNVALKQNAKARESKEYQARFASGYKSQVVGKSIDEISLTRVAGSSLTSNGFNDALEKIKDDAAA